jgi:hypothetical protein
MISYGVQSTIYQDETQDTATANVTRGNRYINMIYRNIVNYWNWPFLETTSTASTVASQQAYTFGYNFRRVKSVTVTVGSTVYPVTEVADWEYWNYLNEFGTNYTSDIPQFFFVKDDTEIQFYPIPSSAGNTITVVFDKAIRDLSASDYTTGTASITTATSKYVITGSGTTWTADMVGRFFQFGTNTRWYEIGTFTSTTSISLVRAYGEADESGDTYTIGEMPLIPEDFHDLIWMGAVGRYWTLKKEDQHAAFYIRQFRDGLEKMKQRYGYKTTGQYIKGYQRFGVIDPNMYPTNLTE